MWVRSRAGALVLLGLVIAAAAYDPPLTGRALLSPPLPDGSDVVGSAAPSANMGGHSPAPPTLYDRLFYAWFVPFLRRYYRGLPTIDTALGSFGGWELEDDAQVCARMFARVGTDVWTAAPSQCEARILKRVVSWGLAVELVILLGLVLCTWRILLRWLPVAAARAGHAVWYTVWYTVCWRRATTAPDHEGAAVVTTLPLAHVQHATLAHHGAGGGAPPPPPP